MKIKDKIMMSLVAIGTFLSALFFSLFKKEKTEKEQIKQHDQEQKQELKNEQTINNALVESKKDLIKEMKEDEELIKTAHGKPNLNSFYAANELLRK